MNKLKSHFVFTKQQRNGIFLLVILIVVFQCVYAFVDFSSEMIEPNTDELKLFQQEIDSLKVVAIENRKPKIFPFNPNFITDYKGYNLGMTNEEIDRLHSFRNQNKWVNSVQDFQQVTKVSDSLLAKISPYFKFPEWVTNPKTKKYVSNKYNNTPKTYAQKQDLNTVNATQLRTVYGIGEKLSGYIIKHRNKYKGGFISDVQLQEVYGLSPEVIVRITDKFTVKTPRHIEKINLNTATKESLVTIQYIDYEIAHNILEARTLRDGFKSLDDLMKVKDFPANKIEIIKLYLTLEQ